LASKEPAFATVDIATYGRKLFEVVAAPEGKRG
jgi:hypothetical protein